MEDIEDISPDILSKERYDKIKQFIIESNHLEKFNDDWTFANRYYLRHYKDNISKKELRYVYLQEKFHGFPNILIKKSMRSEHGVFVVSVVTSPNPEYIDENGEKKVQKFSCKHNCYYCPNDPSQPRSYLRGEPGVDRANSVGFDVVKQIHVRLDSYIMMGQMPDKLEIIVLGGTWSEYPIQYQKTVIRDIYYAANVYHNGIERERLTIEEEVKLNENANVHIIGLTLETRPDSIDMEEIKRFRLYNCTRLQIGLQHTDNDILKIINRGHTIETTKKAIKLLLDNGFKVDIHIMPNLPGSDLEKDKKMVETLFNDSDLQVDQWKIYPTSVVPWSVLEIWFKKGKFVPYSDEVLMEFLLSIKEKIPERIRLNRVVRDIPESYIMGGCKTSHMRQLLQQEMQKRNITCHCIRCRSVKGKMVDPNFILKYEHFIASGADEYFINVVSQDNSTLYGFLRLRIPNPTNALQLDEVKNCALIRELHVYGTVVNVNRNKDNEYQTMNATQHKGFGKMLMKKAEDIAREHDMKSIAVISGVGVRGYYRKLGYTLDKTYMKKDL